MATGQDRVADIISTASEDDPAVKLQNLEREVNLIKTSIKRLLMDIRERLNELENPFTLVSSGSPVSSPGIDDRGADKRCVLEAREAALDARESAPDISETDAQTAFQKGYEADTSGTDLFAAARVHSISGKDHPIPGTGRPGSSGWPVPRAQVPDEKIPLPQAYHLFSWTRHGVKKFGHDRLETLVESYCIMGYIGKKTADEIRQISHLMPVSTGEAHEINPDEFVFEIYTLNRILFPDDTSLDRDMIDVMLEERQQKRRTAAVPGCRNGMPERVQDLNKAESFAFGKKDATWMNLRA
jgi:hypothetical protein